MAALNKIITAKTNKWAHEAEYRIAVPLLPGKGRLSLDIRVPRAYGFRYTAHELQAPSAWHAAPSQTRAFCEGCLTRAETYLPY
jgi:hypothetical protein